MYVLNECYNEDSLGRDIGMDRGPDVLSHVAQELVRVVGVKLSQKRETPRHECWTIQWVRWFPTQ